MDLSELKKLPPEERIAKLKELTEKDKKEIDDAMKLIKDSNEEIEETNKILEKVPIPQIRAVNIESLFSADEKQAFKTMRYVSEDKKESDTKEQKEETIFKEQKANLEESIASERPRISEEEIKQQRQYLHGLGTLDLQSKREQLYSERQDNGYLTETQQRELVNIKQEFEQRQRDFRAGSYRTASEKVEDLLRGNYHS